MLERIFSTPVKNARENANMRYAHPVVIPVKMSKRSH